MADFTINIEDIQPTYNRVSTQFVRNSCNPLIIEAPVEMETGGDAFIFFAFIQNGSYVGDAQKTLRITGVNPSHNDWGLYYDGVEIVEPIDIDISGLVGSVAIPLLTVRSSGYAIWNVVKFISIVFAIVDINDVEGEFLSASMQLRGLECEDNNPPDATIALTGQGVSSCDGFSQLFTVTGDPDQVVKYQIATTNNGNFGYNAILTNVDNSFTFNPSTAPGTGATAEGFMTLDGTGNIDLSYDVCASIGLNPATQNCVSVTFTLYKADNITINTTERFDIYDCHN